MKKPAGGWGAAGSNTIDQSIIKNRDFEVLLFGSITDTPADLYAFWHSSQRNYPGLNISNYASQKLDTQLETLRENNDELERIKAYENVKKDYITARKYYRMAINKGSIDAMNNLGLHYQFIKKFLWIEFLYHIPICTFI